MRRPDPAWPIAAGFLLFYAAMAVQAVWAVPFPNGYDELAHLSYVTRLAQIPLQELDFASMRLLHPSLEPRFGDAGNYLNHPPGYYLAMGRLLPTDGWPTLHSVHAMRLANAALSTAAIAMALATGALRRLAPGAMLLFGVLVTMVPVLRVTGGGITNDNLALFGGCMALLGAQVMLLGRRGGAFCLVGGCAAAACAKFTAAMMLGTFAGVFLLLQAGALGRRRSAMLLAGLALAGTVAGLPYVWFALRFGTPVPVTPAFAAVGAEAADRHLTIYGWMPGSILGLPDYAGHFLRWLLAGWSPVLGIGGWAEAAVTLAPGLVLAAAMPALAANLVLVRRRWADPLLAASAAALLLTLVPHLLFSWQRYHLAFGAPPFDAVPRYYLPVAPVAVPAACCQALARMPTWLRMSAMLLIAAGTLATMPIIAACAADRCW